MIKVPPQNQWIQHNESDVFGNIWASWNIDLRSNEGKLRVSPKSIITTNDITDLGVAVGFDTFTDQNGAIQYLWAVAGAYVFRMNVADGYQTAFAKDSSTGTPTVCSSDLSDIAHFGTTFMIVTVPNDIYRYNASSGQWNDGANELTSGGVHMVCQYGDRFYVVDENVKVKSFTPANYNAITASGSNTINLANKGWNVTSIVDLIPARNGIWIPTVNQSENGCYLFFWDGSTATDPNEAYYIKDASGILAGVIKDDVFWGIDSNAQLRYFNGGTMVKANLGRLPIDNTKFLKNSLSSVNDRWIHPNGIDIVDGRIRISINNEYEDNAGSINERLPSGVWEYDENTGWSHISPIVSTNDFGQVRVSRVGALYCNKTETTNASSNGIMIMGAQVYTNATDTKEVIVIDDSNDTLQKSGYVITQKAYSSEVTDKYQRVIVRHKKLLNSTDEIRVFTRTSEVAPVEATIDWVDDTSFTTTTDVSAYEGYQVEFLQGEGAGLSVKINSVTNNGGTYTVVIDEEYSAMLENTGKARFQYWKQAHKTSQQTESYSEFPLERVTGTWIQVKVVMKWTGENEIDDIIIINESQKMV